MSPLDWSLYREAAEDKPLNPFLSVLAPFLPKNGDALDLGCGTGKAAEWLSEHGMIVDAVDFDAASIEIARQRAAHCHGVHVHHSTFKDFRFGQYDLVLCLFSVFFIPQGDFAELWPKIVGALRPGGLFAGQLIGPDDDWSSEATTSVTMEDVHRLFQGFEFEHLEEVRREGRTVWGEPKQWHIYHIIARKSE